MELLKKQEGRMTDVSHYQLHLMPLLLLGLIFLCYNEMNMVNKKFMCTDYAYTLFFHGSFLV